MALPREELVEGRRKAFYFGSRVNKAADMSSKENQSPSPSQDHRIGPDMDNEPPIEPPTLERLARDTFRILILENPKNIRKLKDACKDAGHSVIGAHTIDEALAFLEGQDHADVIVCAAHMEDESMFEFLRRLLDDEHHKPVMILMLALESGPMGVRINASTERTGKALGVDAYITMPVFDAAALIAAIKRLLPAVPNLEQEKQAGRG